MIAPPMKAVAQRVRLVMLDLYWSPLVNAVEPAGDEPPTSVPKIIGMIQSSNGFLSPPAILAGRDAIDVLRRNQILDEDHQAVQPAGCAQAVSGQEK